MQLNYSVAVNNPIRVMYVVTEDWYFCSHRLDHAKDALQRGLLVSVATRVQHDEATIRDAGLTLHPINLKRASLNPIKELWTVYALFRLFRKERPDYVHLVAMKPLIYGGIAAKLSNVPRVIYAIPGLGYLFSGLGPFRSLAATLVKGTMSILLRRSNAITIVQNTEDLGFAHKVLKVDRDKIKLIAGVGVDIGKFRDRPSRNGVPIVMLPTRLLYDKGVAEFVAAAELLRKTGVQARFVLVGKPDHSNPASIPLGVIHEWCESKLIEYWGHRENMHEILCEADVVCLPSYREGLPKVLLEAGSCARAVVASNVPGCRDVVIDGITGMLVQPKNPGQLATAVKKLVENKGLRTKMGLAARAHIEAKFSVNEISTRINALYTR
jgi:glycosyltransferase involved in cell wall biosynthesis